MSSEQSSFLADLKEFYEYYLVETPSGFIQVFSSFTYGEMVTSFLLLVLVMLFTFKWFWEILRYG